MKYYCPEHKEYYTSKMGHKDCSIFQAYYFGWKYQCRAENCSFDAGAHRKAAAHWEETGHSEFDSVRTIEDLDEHYLRTEGKEFGEKSKDDDMNG